MSDRIGITSFIQSNIAGRINSTVSNAAQSAIRNISGLNRDGNNSSLANIFNLGGGGKFGTNLLAYPFDVDSDPSQGHYIMFNVKEVSAAKLKQNKSRKEFRAIKRDLENELASIGGGGIPSDNEIADFEKINSKIERINDKLNTGGAGGKLNRSIQLAQRPTVRTNTAIALYMPPSVQVSYDVKYGDQPIGSLAQIGLDVIEAFRGTGDTQSKLRALKDKTGATSTEGAKNFLNATLDTVAPGARTLQQIDSGTVITPRMELMFEGVGRRSFNYTFVFIPKSEQESIIVEKIIQAFKVNMMPEYTNDTTRREMKIPNTFDIEYRYQNTENSFLNKISECFLTKADVQYGADRFTAYERTTGQHGTGAPAQKTTLTLAFTELEVLDKSSVEQGF